MSAETATLGPETFSSHRPLVLLGCGRMGGAMLEGWLAKGLAPEATVVIDPKPSAELQRRATECGFRLDGLTDVCDPRAVVVAVKPQLMAEALPAVARYGGGEALFISIAAGTTVGFFEEQLGAGSPIVRAMPNTPAAVGEGASALYANAACGQGDRAVANALLSAVGEAVWLDNESLMDAVTAVSGSGPAYVFHMIEALAAAGADAGLPEDLAMRLARRTVIGAAALARESSEDAATLRENVTSPRGTTAAALSVLMRDGHGLKPLMREAVLAAAQRGKELAG